MSARPCHQFQQVWTPEGGRAYCQDPYLSSVHLPWNPNICLYIIKFTKVPRSRFIRQAKCLWKDNGNSSGGPLDPFCCLYACVVHSHTFPVKWHEWQHLQESEYCQTNTQQSQKHILQKMLGVKWQACNGLGHQFLSLCFCSCLMLKQVNLKLFNKWIPAWVLAGFVLLEGSCLCP